MWFPSRGRIFISSHRTARTRLAHEIERYDPDTGALKARVRMPVISAADDTVFYLCYGHHGTDTASGGVWDAHFRLVRRFDAAAEGGTEGGAGAEDPGIDGAITVEAWVHSEAAATETVQVLVSQWPLRTAMDAFETYDAGQTDGGGRFQGVVAEVRISDLARSGDWIRATCRNLEAPSDFVRMWEEDRV